MRGVVLQWIHWRRSRFDHAVLEWCKLLAIEVKRDLSKAERDRLIGQTAGYSREWVTWIVLVDTPASRVGAVEKLLADKGLSHILVFAFS
jgi:hypothetical protein